MQFALIARVAIVALAASRTKSQVEADGVTALPKENQVIIMCAPGHRHIQQNETVGSLARA